MPTHSELHPLTLTPVAAFVHRLDQCVINHRSSTQGNVGANAHMYPNGVPLRLKLSMPLHACASARPIPSATHQRYSTSENASACVLLTDTAGLTRFLMKIRVNACARKLRFVNHPRPSTCQCQCPGRSHQICPNPRHIFDKWLCKCVCAHQPMCKAPQAFDKKLCSCKYPSARPTCTTQQIFNTQKCECECLHTPKHCPLPQVFNIATCRCGCPTKSIIIKCKRPKLFDPRTCKCVCPRHQCLLQNKDTCKCTWPRDLECPPPLIYNPRTVKCQCPYRLACKHPREFNPKTCTCICPNEPACSKGYTDL